MAATAGHMTSIRSPSVADSNNQSRRRTMTHAATSLLNGPGLIRARTLTAVNAATVASATTSAAAASAATMVTAAIPISWHTSTRADWIRHSGKDVTRTLAGDQWVTIRGATTYTTGKHCFLFKVQQSVYSNIMIGVIPDTTTQVFNEQKYIGRAEDWGWSIYTRKGTRFHDGSNTAYTAAIITTHDVIGMQLDMDSRTVSYSKNGVELGVAHSNITAAVCVAVSLGDEHDVVTCGTTKECSAAECVSTAAVIYTTDLFMDAAAVAELMCTVCNNVAQQPYNLPCGDLVCSTCMQSWCTSNNSVNISSCCPTCRGPLPAGDPSSWPFAAHVQKTVNALKVRCRQHQRGCHDTHTIGSSNSGIIAHRLVCRKEAVQCADCELSTLRESLVHHLSHVCQQRTVACVICSTLMTAVEMKAHVNNSTRCSSDVRECPNKCTATVPGTVPTATTGHITVLPVNRIEQHLLVCASQRVRCAVCDTELRRCDMSKHYSNNSEQHMVRQQEVIAVLHSEVLMLRADASKHEQTITEQQQLIVKLRTDMEAVMACVNQQQRWMKVQQQEKMSASSSSMTSNNSINSSNRGSVNPTQAQPEPAPIPRPAMQRIPSSAQSHKGSIMQQQISSYGGNRISVSSNTSSEQEVQEQHDILEHKLVDQPNSN